jgi:hypothetical protein
VTRARAPRQAEAEGEGEDAAPEPEPQPALEAKPGVKGGQAKGKRGWKAALWSKLSRGQGFEQMEAELAACIAQLQAEGVPLVRARARSLIYYGKKLPSNRLQ